MRAALYARVSTPASSKRSTRDGDRERQDPEVQLIKLRAYAQARGWTVVDEYIDRRSGANPDRPALKRLEADIDAGKVDAVLTWLEHEASEARRVLEAERDPGNIKTMRQWVYLHECLVRLRLDEMGLLDVDDEPAGGERHE